MKSLLGQFYQRIKGSQEDIASEGLVYILNQTSEGRKSINQIIKNDTGIDLGDLTYATQITGKNKERPDISGINKLNNEEELIIEAKFWASLTQNQPNGYLNRLNNDTVLMFLVPSLRKNVVFNEIISRVKELNQRFDIDNDLRQIKLIESNKYVIVKTWDEILNSIKYKLVAENNQPLISDINQIIGLCKTIDNNTFQPIMEEDLSPSIPQKINSYYTIVNSVVENLKKRNDLFSTDDLKKTSQNFGYHRYFKYDNLGLAMALKLDYWEKHDDTPFWLLISEFSDKTWQISNKMKMEVESIGNRLNKVTNSKYIKHGVFISLKPLLYKVEDEVVKNLADQIEEILNQITIDNNG